MTKRMNFTQNYNNQSKHQGSVWNPESARERKKNAEKNDFLMFGSVAVENIKENQT